MLIVYFMENLVDFVKIVLKRKYFMGSNYKLFWLLILYKQFLRYGELMDLYLQEYLEPALYYGSVSNFMD